jgi:hypothetical protein
MTVAWCIGVTYDCLDVEYPMTPEEWVDAVQDCYDTTPTCDDYVNCLIDQADCPYFEGAVVSGGAGGEGGTVGPTIDQLCNRVDECNLLAEFFEAFLLEPGSVNECIALETVCVDENFLTPSLQEDWALIVRGCLEFSSCPVFFGCWVEIPGC